MKAAAFIPIKSHSERVPGKNFRFWRGRPLYQWIITHALEAGCFAEVFVDTDSEEIAEFAMDNRVHIIRRVPALASDRANGNDLIAHHFDLFPDFDAYFQLFATAPDLKPETIATCVDELTVQERLGQFDSVATVRKIPGWPWMVIGGLPFPLYRPDVLPRSQDWQQTVEYVTETTGLYGIFRDPLKRTRQRVGCKPLLLVIPDSEAVDIDTPQDMAIGAA